MKVDVNQCPFYGLLIFAIAIFLACCIDVLGACNTVARAQLAWLRHVRTYLENPERDLGTGSQAQGRSQPREPPMSACLKTGVSSMI